MTDKEKKARNKRERQEMVPVGEKVLEQIKDITDTQNKYVKDYLGDAGKYFASGAPGQKREFRLAGIQGAVWKAELAVGYAEGSGLFIALKCYNDCKSVYEKHIADDLMFPCG